MMTPQRLVEELNSLVKEITLNNFKLVDGLTPHPVLTAAVITHNGHHYGLEIDLKGYPEQMPRMCVPQALKKRDGTLMSLSSAMHCLGIRDGKTYICHGSVWRPETSLFHLYIKGKLWLEAYEGHLETGNDIDYYLKEE